MKSFKAKKETLSELLPYLLQRASFLVTEEFHKNLRLNGVSVSRWRMLAWLSENQPFSINDLSQQLMLKQPSVTTLVDRAVQDGLLRKTTDKNDGRRVLVTLTRRGERLASELKKSALDAERLLEESLGSERSIAVKSELRKLIGSFPDL